MTLSQLISQIKQKQSMLCVGLDPDISKIPKFLLDFEDPIFEFNKRIIDATKPFAIAYKPNFAFYEALGSKGWDTLYKTAQYLPKETFNIADAKRGDIGNTSKMYAKAVFEEMGFDAITLSPYMGIDSIEPFLEYEDKFSILLALTSNAGSSDFQKKYLANGTSLASEVIRTSLTWKNSNRLMFVIGATHPEDFKELRNLAPDSFFLVPGVGAQGGRVKDVCAFGLNKNAGLLINSSRGIIYAVNDETFDAKAALAAEAMQKEMSEILNQS